MRRTYSNLLQKKSWKSEITNFVDLKWNPKCQASQRALPRPLSRPSLSMISRVSICCASVCVCVCMFLSSLNSTRLSSLHSLLGIVVYEYSCYTRSFICSHYNYQRPRGAKGPKDINNNNRDSNNTYAICLNSTWPECWIALDMGNGTRQQARSSEWNSGVRRMKKATKWGNGIAVSLSCYTNKLILGPDVPNV